MLSVFHVHVDIFSKEDVQIAYSVLLLLPEPEFLELHSKGTDEMTSNFLLEGSVLF